MRILSVNVGSSEPLVVKSATTQSGIFKMPATGPVQVSRLGLKDDVRIEPRKLGLEHSAVYAYPFEHYAFWQQELGRDKVFPMGQFGENLTVSGLLEDQVRIGDIFRFGNTILQVAHPRIPCAKLNARMGLRFAPMFLASRKVGFYFRVLSEGTLEQGDSIELLERDAASPTMEEFVRVSNFEFWDVEGLSNLLKARDLMPGWKEIIDAKIAKAQSVSGWHGLREFRIINRVEESADVVSFTLECLRGRNLPVFRGGQKLMVVLGGRGGGVQHRRAFYLSSSPKQLDNYRITVRLKESNASDADEREIENHLTSLKVGDTLLCTSAHGLVRSLPAEGFEERMPVLISQGLGIAPMLSMLYEFQGLQPQVMLFHEAADNEPQFLLEEARTIVKRNFGFEMICANTNDQEPPQLTAKWVSEFIAPGQCNIEVAGTKTFVDRIMNEFMFINVSPGALVMFTVD